MPRYTYTCCSCQVFYQKNHSIKEKLTDCEECGEKGALKRVPSTVCVVKNEEAGGLVKQHIDELKKDLQEEKDELKKVEYE